MIVILVNTYGPTCMQTHENLGVFHTPGDNLGVFHTLLVYETRLDFLGPQKAVTEMLLLVPHCKNELAISTVITYQ